MPTAMVVDNRWQFQSQSSLECILKLLQIGPEFFLLPIENDFSSLIVFQVGGAKSIRLNVIAFYSLCKRTMGAVFFAKQQQQNKKVQHKTKLKQSPSVSARHAASVTNVTSRHVMRWTFSATRLRQKFRVTATLESWS